ncbi:DIS3-like exonuclease 1 isoform X1 [Hydra vulgaris]|uniref:DIS3-like exonuclease 1 isoform X1 n=1 Tax=Hydra vulgaris TaxID=6087 RepID=UPI001F5EA40E|nr:DIS3-like exonuclease 1 [Hydra vulgaris]
MQKLDKLIHLKRNSKNVKIVCEHYLRNDIPCKNVLCNSCEKVPGKMLAIECTHYIVPDCEVTQVYLEVLELKPLTGVIFMQTVLNYIQQVGNKKQYEKLKLLFKDIDKGCILFNNEHHEGCYIKRSIDTNIEMWRMLNIYNAAKWYHSHLNGAVSVVILTENEQFLKTYRSETPGVFVMTTEDYLKGFWPNFTEALDLYDSLTSLVGSETNIGTAIVKDYCEYYPRHVLEAGIKSGRFVSSYLRVNKHNPIQEAFVSLLDSKETSQSSDILIPGTALRNRAVDGDLVVVELLPREKWQAKVTSITLNDDKTILEKESKTMVTGCVVGILQRNFRDYVVSIPESEFLSNFTGGRLLTVPWDIRIPKIRICTHQVNKLKDKRFVVRIDSWDVSSLYPNGHFVKVLGNIGDVEAEIATILVEHGFLLAPFSDQIMKEMPNNTNEDPWKITEHELLIRRDLRNSHLVFSIDPKDCEDVDDTLSVRVLDSETIELGVHIADVSHFVKPNSFTDIEAQSRSTTVYLADRRYDMLPSILSADLCSLISGVDRYAVSVIWKLNKCFEVVDVWYGRSIIKSKYKLYYEAAQTIIDDQLHIEELPNIIPEFKNIDSVKLKNCYNELQKSLCLLMKIARNLKMKRSTKGAVDLESSEIQITVNNAKQVNGLEQKKKLEIHEVIAECMIFANHWVAKKLLNSFKSNSLLRCHPPPYQEYFGSLKDFAKAAGFELDTSSNKSLANSLDVCTMKDPNINKVFRMLATQAMNVASYFSTGSLAAEKYYHYGLALDVYTHFTSPIRRYADVLVHRLLLASVNESSSDQNLLGNNDLQSICDYMNIKHREADHAQKASVQFFLSQYFKSNQSDDNICLADALVYNLRSNGVLVFVPRYGIKGVVLLRNKVGDVAYEDSLSGCIVYKPGSLSTSNDRITIRCNNSSRDVTLFSYLKIRICVNSSRVHLEALNFELLSFLSNVKFDIDTTKVDRADIIKDVKDIEAVKNESILLQKNNLNEHLKKTYGQTHKSVSLYEMFRSFKQISLYERTLNV